MNQTPVAWMYNFRPYGRDSEPLAVGWLSKNRAEAFEQNCKDQQPLFTLDQLNQARADALREAAEKFDKKAGCANVVGGCSTLAAIELRRMADEMEKGK